MSLNQKAVAAGQLGITVALVFHVLLIRGVS